jgi:hypothetical protein
MRAFSRSPGTTFTFRVLVHHFAQPVTVGAISLGEPGS